MVTLNRNNSNWSFEERRKINENWAILESMGNSTASNSNGLRQEVDQLKVTVGENAIKTRDALQIANQAKVASDLLRDELNQIIIESGDSNPEIVSSRTNANSNETFTTLQNRLDSENSRIYEQLELKRDLNNTIKLSDLSQEVREALTGGSVAIVGNNSVGDAQLMENVSLEKFRDVQFNVTSNNIIDYRENRTDGYYDQGNGIFVQNSNYGSTNFFRVQQGVTYHFRTGGGNNLTFWDADYNFISGAQPSASVGTFTIPNNPNIVYARCSITLYAGFNNALTAITRGVPITNETPTNYDYQYVLNNKFKVESNIDVSQVNAFAGKESVNIFNRAEAERGFYIRWEDGQRVLNANFGESGFIEAESGEVFFKNRRSGNIAFYNSKREFVVGVLGSDVDFFTVPNNENIRYARVSFPLDIEAQIVISRTNQIVNGYTPYDPDGISLKSNIKVSYSSLDQETKDKLNAIDSPNRARLLFTNQYKDDVNIQEFYDEVTGLNYWITRINNMAFDGKKILPKSFFTTGNINTPANQGLNVSQVVNDPNNDYLAVINTAIYNVSTFGAEGYVIIDGVILRDQKSTQQPGAYVLGITADGTMRAYDQNLYTAQQILDDGIVQAFVAFVPMIIDGQGVSDEILNRGSNSFEPNPRQVLGQLDNGDYIIATFDGRFNNIPGFTLRDIIDILLPMRVKFAYNLDGGGSTQTFVGKKRINRLLENRKLGLVMGFEKQQ